MENMEWQHYGLSNLVWITAKTALGTQRDKARRVTCGVIIGQISDFSIQTSGGLLVVNPKKYLSEYQQY